MHAGEALTSHVLGVAHLSPVAPQRKGTRDLVPSGGKSGTGSCNLSAKGRRAAQGMGQQPRPHGAGLGVSWGNNVSHSQ